MKKIKNVIIFILIAILVRLWLRFDQDFLPEKVLLPAFIALLFSMTFLYFVIANPQNVKRFTRIIAGIIFITVLILSLFQHLVMASDFLEVWRKSVVIWLLAFILPFITGYVYSLSRFAQRPQR